VKIIWSVSACPENISLSHNASSYTTPSPLYNSPLYFNTSIGIAFQCNFNNSYPDITTYQWYVNGIVRGMGQYFDYYFTTGNYEVECVAQYTVLNCPPCKRDTSVPITIDGISLVLPMNYCDSYYRHYRLR